MKLAVFGATGAAGRQVVDIAIAAGHAVTAVVRDSARLPARERLRVLQGDVSDAESVRRAVAGQDAIICAVGPSKGAPAASVISSAARNIVDAMRGAGVQRLVFTSGRMVGPARGASLVQRTAMAIFRRLNSALFEDKLIAEKLVSESGLSWVIVRPPLFKEGPARGSWQMGEEIALNLKTMSARDVAGALLQAATDDRLVKKAVELGY